jgi:uncharacterized repeat protein (TIGR02543 family)
MKFLRIPSVVALLALAGISLPLSAQNLTQTNAFLPDPQFYPQFLASGTSSRLPVMFRATVANLDPSTTYRYFTQVATNSDIGAANSGAGNPVLVSTDGTTFVYSTGASLTTAGNYGTFTTDTNGTYTGWFGFVNTGNARFNAGAVLVPTLTIGNASGTLLHRWAPPAASGTMTSLGFSPSPGLPNGTGIRGTNSSAVPKNFIVLHDNTAGSGRPLAATYVEDEGVNVGSVVAYYGTATGPVNAINGAWGSIVPNALANGVRRIAQYNNAGVLVGGNADADGVWAASGSTVNPTGGSTTPIDILAADAPLNVAYTITYNGNGNTGGTAPVEPNNPQPVNGQVTVLGPGTLTKTGSSFTGWNTAADGSGTGYAPGSPLVLTSNTTLYAQWTVGTTYTVTYNGNGNTGGTPPVDPSSPYTSGATVTVLGNTGGLVKTGHTFAGWNTAADGSGTDYAPAATFTINADTVLFAKWTPNTYTVTYNGNGNTGGTAPVDPSSPYTFGSTVTVLGPGTLTKTGSTFANWNTAADGSGVSYAPAATFTISANTLLYAIWQAVPTNGPFTPGNLAVLSADVASANNTTFSILEVNPALTNQTAPVQTIGINGTNGASALRTSGSATSTGYLMTSEDGTLLAFTGHNTTNALGNVNTNLLRGVGTLDSSGTFALPTTYTSTSGNQTRSATSLDNLTWYIGDQGGIFTNESTVLNNANVRSVKSFGGTLYVLRQSATPAVTAVATLSPDGTTLTGLPGLTNSSTAVDFYLIASGSNGATNDVLYVLENSSATVGRIAKFSLVAGEWVANGVYTNNFGGFGLCARTNAGGAALFITSGSGATAANSIRQVTDTAGYNAAITVNPADLRLLYTAASGATLKGIAFAPVAGSTITVPVITAVSRSGTNTTITFTGAASDPASAFAVVGTTNLATTPFAPVSATINTVSPGVFQATVPGAAPAAFYRIQR